MQEQRPPFTPGSELPVVLSSISPSFDGLSRTPRQVIHVLLTRAPVYLPSCPDFLPRLACLRHAASVRSEPGSNSPLKLSYLIRSARLTCRNRWTDRYYKPRNRTGFGSLQTSRRPIKGMHYYSVFKDPRPLEANSNPTARRACCQSPQTEHSAFANTLAPA